MSNTYKLNLKQLRQENLKSTFESFERAMNDLEIDFYLIGAIARDTWFARQGIRALGTKDIDLAVFISGEGRYDELKKYLTEKEGFIASSTNDYTFFDKQGYQVDILPFGSIEIEGKKFINSTGVASTKITGFTEVYEEATQLVNFEDQHTFKVSTMAGIIILKLIAWDDRPEMRTKDIQDIGIILSNYYNLEMEMIIEKYFDLIDYTENTMAIASRVIGREMKTVLDQNNTLKERIISILDLNTNDPATSELGRLLSKNINIVEPTVEDAVNLLVEIKKGINDL